MTTEIFDMFKITTLQQQNFLSAIESWSAKFQKLTVRSSPDPAKIGFSPDPVPCNTVRAHPCRRLNWSRILKFQKFSGKSDSGHPRSGVPESTAEGFCVFLSDPDPSGSQKFVKSRTRIRSHFSISVVAGVCMDISQVKTWLNYGWIEDCSRSLNNSPIKDARTWLHYGGIVPLLSKRGGNGGIGGLT